jgi:uncharacterized membrane protein SirB2
MIDEEDKYTRISDIFFIQYDLENRIISEKILFEIFLFIIIIVIVFVFGIIRYKAASARRKKIPLFFFALASLCFVIISLSFSRIFCLVNLTGGPVFLRFQPPTVA